MSKIMDMIKNEKVEWKKLGEVCEIVKGKQFNKRDMLEEGKYPVINGGITPSGYVEVYNQSANIITISQGGASAGFINFIENKFWLGAHAFAINPKDTVLNRYIYHFLKMNQEKLQDKKEGAGIPSISKTTLENFLIPIPSLETQEKIVKILDKFTNYVTELQAELQARIKQYSYYRDMLLSEENLNKLSKKIDKLENKKYKLRITTLGEIGEFTRGNGLQKSDFKEEGKPVIHYGQIYTKYGFSTDKTFSFTDEETFKRLRKAKTNDILIATTSENIEDVAKCLVWLGNTEIGFSGDMYSYNTSENSKYIAYYFQTVEFQRQKERKVTGTKLIRIHGEDMAKFIIPLPPISIQNKVVEILDKFQDLLQDTKGLLPQEIEQREKQYEYYREKLLTFGTDVARERERESLVHYNFFTLLKEAAEIVGVKLFEVKWRTLGEISQVTKLAGYEFTKYVKYSNKGEKIALRGLNIKKGKIILDDVKYIDESDFSKLTRSKLKKEDLLFTYVGTIGEVALIEENDKFYLAPNVALIRNKEKEIISKYLLYYFQSTYFKNFQITKYLGQSSMKNLTMGNIRKFSIMIPPLEIQQYIVNILDKFDTLANDLTKGLPKEIELRQKQYEYYREKLLTFSKND